MSASAPAPTFDLDPFAFKQFDDDSYGGTRISCDKTVFAARINELYATGEFALVDGYAPFCKHLFVPNFTGARTSYLKITPENEGHLRSGYEARKADELPVLGRWFPLVEDDPPPVSKFLDVILYSREQINKEAAAMGREEEPTTAPWGIISIKSQDVAYELPMNPITMMRNALGREEGGSGVALDRAQYAASVAFWKEHAVLK